MSKQLVLAVRRRPRRAGGVRGALAAMVLAAIAALTPLHATTAQAATGGVDPATDMAAVSWGPNRIDLFAKGTDGTLKHKLYNGRWSTWENLGGAITSAPAVASWEPGRLDVFARSTTNSLLHRWYAKGAWSGWEDLGGSLYSAPAAVSWGPAGSTCSSAAATA
jgi:hypothetical protein